MSAREELIEFMLQRCENFATTAATRVIDLGAIDELYLLATDSSLSLPKAQKQMVIFRSAYTLEYIYFNYPYLFFPFRERFFSDFPLCENSSARRHFTKMMIDILKYYTPTSEQIESIVEAAANWITEPRAKVAVKIWSMSILKTLKPKVVWLDDIWADLEAVVTDNATPAIQVCLRRGW